MANERKGVVKRGNSKKDVQESVCTGDRRRDGCFKVDKWVPDPELEELINKRDSEGWYAEHVFRNPPVSAGGPTTTIIWEKV